MTIIHCLWIGALAGLVVSRLARGRAVLASATSSIAVGVLGALLGGLAESWIGAGSRSFPHSDLFAAGLGAVLAFIAWSAAHRTLFANLATKEPSDAR